MDIKAIEKDYKLGLTYKKIAEKYNITVNQLKNFIQVNKWTRKSNRKKVLKGNRNAIGNKSSTRFQKGNKVALTTGEYENIFSGCFSDVEMKFFFADIEIDKEKEIIEEYKILKLREARMLRRIEILKNGKNLTLTSIQKSKGNNSFGDFEDINTSEEITVMLIQKIDEGLTRVQDSMRRCLETMHKMGIDDKKLEIELSELEGDEIEDTSETDADIYGC